MPWLLRCVLGLNCTKQLGMWCIVVYSFQGYLSLYGQFDSTADGTREDRQTGITAQQPDIHWRYLGYMIRMVSWMPPGNAFPGSDWWFCQPSHAVCAISLPHDSSHLMLEMSCRCSSVVSISGRTEANHSTLFSAAYCFSTAKSFSLISGSSPKICSTWRKTEQEDKMVQTRWLNILLHWCHNNTSATENPSYITTETDEDAAVTMYSNKPSCWTQELCVCDPASCPRLPSDCPLCWCYVSASGQGTTPPGGVSSPGTPWSTLQPSHAA